MPRQFTEVGPNASALSIKRLFGSTSEPNNKILMVISSGNLPIEARINSPLINADFTIQDPAQSYNAITVGAYTLKDRIDLTSYPDAELLSRKGRNVTMQHNFYWMVTRMV